MNSFIQKIIYGHNGYVEFHTGNMNLLISVPHDGCLMPDTITNRAKDDLNNYKRDLNTRKVAFEISNGLKELFKSDGKMPFMVFNNLHRIKVDPNRDERLCCENFLEDGFIAYNEYHNFIEVDFEQNFVKANNFSNALLIDLHGQNHPEKMVELGYLLSAKQLNNSLTLKNSKISSIHRLAMLSGYSFDQLIRGAVSFGAILKENLGDVVDIVPSLTHQSPGNASYYSGGHIIERHGSKCVFGSKSFVSAIQVELPAFMRTESDFANYTHALALSIYQFLKIHNF